MASKPGKSVSCAIYTRKSTEHGLELEFNSLDAQREACEAYIKSQTHEGWKALSKRYDDPAYSVVSPMLPSEWNIVGLCGDRADQSLIHVGFVNRRVVLSRQEQLSPQRGFQRGRLRMPITR